MNPLVQEIIAGCVVALFVAALGLMRSTSRDIARVDKSVKVLEAEFRMFKEFFLRTAERRDAVVKTAERWREYALRLQAIDPRVYPPPMATAATAVCEEIVERQPEDDPEAKA